MFGHQNGLFLTFSGRFLVLARRSPFFLRRDAKFLHSVAFGDGVTRARSLGPIGKTEGRVSKTTNAVLGRTSDGQSGSAYLDEFCTTKSTIFSRGFQMAK